MTARKGRRRPAIIIKLLLIPEDFRFGYSLFSVRPQSKEVPGIGNTHYNIVSGRRFDDTLDAIYTIYTRLVRLKYKIYTRVNSFRVEYNVSILVHFACV